MSDSETAEPQGVGGSAARGLGGEALLPLLYVAWADGSLRMGELRVLFERAVDLWSLEPQARARVARLLDPDRPPSAAELADVLAEIRRLSAGLPQRVRASLADLGLAIAGADGAVVPDERRALEAIEAALEGGGAGAARRRLLEPESRTVADVMRREVEVVSPEMPVSSLESAFLGRGVGGFPVVDEGRMVGIVSRSDVVRRLCIEGGLAEEIADHYREAGAESGASLREIGERMGSRLVELRVRDLMTTDVHTVAPDLGLAEAAGEMRRHGVHRLPVVAADGALVGMLTALDLAGLFADGKASVTADAGALGSGAAHEETEDS
ncbi:MAG: CBS domain-containing protein [Thermoanaerobaculia bacterium]|nr:CBS domain-containing protein [Thermoanaerobaculia bacterium]